MERLLIVALASVGLVQATPAAAEPELPEMSASIAVGYVANGDDTSFLDEGFGKSPYGSSDAGPAYVDGFIELNQQFGTSWGAKLTLSGSNNLSPALGVSEATLTYRPLPESGLRYRVKLGAFRPPVSFEHSSEGWTTQYTVLASAINSWVGEEVGALGTEVKVGSDDAANPTGWNWDLFASGFYGNDPAGAMLAWGGWTFWNGQTRYGDRIEWAPIPVLDIAQPQSHYAEPYIETDHRPGYYVGGTFDRGQQLRVRALYYDNRADPNSYSNGQWGWRTRFTSVAAQASLPMDVGVIAQWLGGSSTTWDVPPPWSLGPVSDIDYHAAFTELTKAFFGQRLTVRYDWFGVSNLDKFPGDPNGETGHAWTASYQWQISRQWVVSVEQLWIEGHRTARELLALDPNYDERVSLATLRWQL
jgi:hypothetical protein